MTQIKDAAPDLLEAAWGIIANAGWDGMDKTPGWQEAAVRWREQYFAWQSETSQARIAELANELHAEHHSGVFVPTLDSCPEHDRAAYEELARDLLNRAEDA